MAKKSKFEMVKNFYDNGLWKEKRVRDAVVKGWISPENFKEITGEDYDEQEDERDDEGWNLYSYRSGWKRDCFSVWRLGCRTGNTGNFHGY